MKIITAVDDNGGLLFNNRRQSRDRVLRDYIVELTSRHTLWINSYTAKLFDEIPEHVIVDDDFLYKAGLLDYCWVENQHVSEIADNISEVILFHWNRQYPGDFFFDLDLREWKLIATKEFSGSSHKQITQENYIR